MKIIIKYNKSNSRYVIIYFRGDTMFRNGPLMDPQWIVKINGKFDILANSHRV